MNKSQIEASNPFVSAWVMASAGTGKTKLLVDRLIRLLLLGNRPSKILCLTYTKAAAFEMKERLKKKLFLWTTLSQSELEKEVKSLDEGVSCLEKARELFSVLIDEDINIQTIHSFCQKILMQFPLEAGVSPGFSLLDDSDTKEIVEKCFTQALLDPSLFSEAFLLCDNYSETYLLEIVFDALSKRHKIMSFQDNHFALTQHLKHDAFRQESVQKLESIRSFLEELCFYGPKNLISSAKKALLCEEISFDLLFPVFLTNEGEPRKKIITKKHNEINQNAEEIAEKNANVCREEFLFLEKQKVVDLTKAFHRFFKQFLDLYDYEKERLQSLDFDDLLLKTQELLKKEKPWVFFKLEGLFDHLLIDEAQDTSPLQWDVLLLMLEEFYKIPSKASDPISKQQAPRTLFVVGDPKQSIYSFQGADPNYYLQIKEKIRRLAQKEGHLFEDVSLDICYRSSQHILKSVDGVINDPIIYPSLLHEGAIRHNAFRRCHQSHVITWPLIAPIQKVEEKEWFLPTEPVLKKKEEDLLAEKISTNIKEMLESGFVLESTQKAIQPEDIIILLQKRTTLMETLTRTLKNHGIPVAGLDRLAFYNHIFVKDLLAFGRFFSAYYDDYNLACLLKTPFIGMCEKDLFELCQNKEMSLWENLVTSQKHKEIVLFLTDFQEKAKQTSAFSFFSELCTALSSRALSFFGNEAIDLMETFLNKILDFQEVVGTSIAAVMDRFEKCQDIKVVLRRGEGVKLMTVHGAKGLQAPIVILADAGSSNSSQLDKIVYGPNFFCLRLPTTTLFELKELERKASLAERNRLFYVAITRAQDFLIATGIEKTKLHSWYDFIEKHRTTTEVLPFLKTAKELAKDLQKDEEIAESYLMPYRIKTATEAHEQPTKATRKGEHVHKVIELFANFSLEQQSLSFIKSLGLDTMEEIDLDCVKTVICDQFYNELIQGESYRELSLIFHEKGRSYQLRLDHVVFNGNQITILDYKTSQTVPSLLEGVPREYHHQMGLYRRVLKKMYPQKKIRCFLIYIHPLRFFELHNDFDEGLRVKENG